MVNYCEDCIHSDICKWIKATIALEEYMEKIHNISDGLITAGDIKCGKKMTATTDENHQAIEVVDCETIHHDLQRYGNWSEGGSEYHIGDDRYVQCKRTKYWHSEGEECSCN